MRPISYGSKYQDKLDVKEIAILIRADIKAAVKAGDLPKGLKTSVRISRYAGGRSIDVEVTAVPEGFQICSETALQRIYGPPHFRQSEQARKVLDVLEKIHAAYNFDGSEMESDYFHVNFYGSAKFDWRLEEAEHKAYELRQAMTEAAKKMIEEVA